MKDSILSILRHSFTGLAGLGGFLVSRNLADPADAAALDAAGATVGDALAVIVAVVVARLVLALLGKLGGKEISCLVLAVGTGAGALAICPPSCSPDAVARFQQAAQAVPVQACYYDKDGNRICYSTKDGVLLEVDERSGK